MDEIIAEVRKIREEYAAEHNYDLDEIFEDLKQMEASSIRPFVDLRQKTRNDINKHSQPYTSTESSEPANLQVSEPTHPNNFGE